MRPSRNSRMSMKLALLVDFDGTVTEKDVATMLLEAFALEDWHPFASMRDAGLITGKECLIRQFACLPSREEELTRFATERAVVRPGFSDLVSYCREEGLPLALVSGGLGFYIQAVLSRHGIFGIPAFSGRADFTTGDRIGMDYDGCPAVCDMMGACKCFHVHRYAALDYKTVLIGDGSTDMCAAERADYVFARSKLQTHCEAQGIPFFPFSDFHDVLSTLRALETAGPG